MTLDQLSTALLTLDARLRVLAAALSYDLTQAGEPSAVRETYARLRQLQEAQGLVGEMVDAALAAHIQAEHPELALPEAGLTQETSNLH